MKRRIDIDAILAPIPGDSPTGEDLRYTGTYDEIKEAKRADDLLNRGDWEREIKTSDWDKVITLAADALTHKSKDLQIAAWLCEALTATEHLEGFSLGLKVINGFLSEYWEGLYPAIEDRDLEFRVGPLEYLNNNLSLSIRKIPITDTKSTPGHSWFKWQESREVGREEDTHNQFGDTDEKKKKQRDEMIADGKLTAEDFDSAVIRSPVTYYESLAKNLTHCEEEFAAFDEFVDMHFVKQSAPNLQEIRKALEDLKVFMGSEIIRAKLKAHEKAKENLNPDVSTAKQMDDEGEQISQQGIEDQEVMEPIPQTEPSVTAMDSGGIGLSESIPMEATLWESALETLNRSGLKNALVQLHAASCRAPSEREKNCCRLLMAKLCLKAERPDLARPIVEQLYALIEELHLERWEDPVWIGEVLDALYMCLTAGEPADDDIQRAKDLLQKLCTIDVTKAMRYRH